MKIEKKEEGTLLIVYPQGRLDANAAPEFTQWFEEQDQKFKSYKLDLCDLDYISSAGLRVLISLHKTCLSTDKNLVITGCNDVVMDIFQMTRMVDVLNFE